MLNLTFRKLPPPDEPHAVSLWFSRWQGGDWMETLPLLTPYRFFYQFFSQALDNYVVFIQNGA
jgi:hypothetical protein